MSKRPPIKKAPRAAPRVALKALYMAECGHCDGYPSETGPPARRVSSPIDPRPKYSAQHVLRCGNCGAQVHVLIRTLAADPRSLPLRQDEPAVQGGDAGTP